MRVLLLSGGYRGDFLLNFQTHIQITLPHANDEDFH